MGLIERLRRAFRRRWRRLRRWSVRNGVGRTAGLAVLGLLVLSLLLFAYQGFRAASDLRAASSQAEILQEQVVTGDGGAAQTLTALRDSTSSAEGHTDGVLWSIGQRLPIIGKNIRAMRTVSAVLDDVVRDALPPVVDVSNGVDINAFSPRSGTIDLAAVRRVAPAVATADRVLTTARQRLEKVDTTDLLLPLRGAVGSIQEKVYSAQSAAASSDVAARLMPQMLGQKGTRRYLLLIQNNAEARPTGGIPGSFAIITAKNGRLRMGEQGSIFDLPQFTKPVVPMTASEKSVFTAQLVRDLRDITLTPDFPRTGEIARAMASKGLGVDVDGVLSVDPVAMSYLLVGTGPVGLDGGVTIDGASVVELLLNRVYLAFTDLNAQDDFFEGAARGIFDAVKSGATPSRPIIAGLVRAADENRLMLWSADRGEQRLIATTGIGGQFSRDAGATPHVGVYFADALGGKLQYYFDFTTVATSRRCLEGGRQQITLSTQLISNAPRGLPKRVAGLDPRVPAGEMRLLTYLYAPFGGRFADIQVDGKKQLITTAQLDGRAETSVPVSLSPGQRRVLTATIITGPGQRADGVLSTTPGIHTLRNDTPIVTACG